MGKGNGSITLRSRFPAGTEVQLRRRVGDGGPGGEVVASEKVSKSSEVRFTGLEPYAQFFAVAEVGGDRQVVQVTAKPPNPPSPDLANTRHAHQERLRQEAQARSAQHEAAVEKDPLAGSPALGEPDTSRQVVRGARSTESGLRLRSADGLSETRFASETAGRPSEEKPKEEVQPHPRQEDVPDSVPQMSSTITGEATPVDPGQLVPEIPQSAVPEGTPQRSDTELGSAAIVPEGEVQPSLKQEDVPDGTPQRSDTPLGEAEPIPQGDPIDVKRRLDSSQAKAEGETAAKPQEQTVEGAAKKSSSARKSSKKAAKKRAPTKRKAANRSGAKKSSGPSKAARSRAAKKAAATRKRNARKGR